MLVAPLGRALELHASTHFLNEMLPAIPTLRSSVGNGAQESGAEESGPRETRVWKNMDVTQTNVWTCLASSFSF